jgi:cell division protein FtsA
MGKNSTNKGRARREERMGIFDKNDSLLEESNDSKEELINLQNLKEEDITFALDIGTRSIVGIVGMRTDDSEKLKILAVEVLEHDKRAMLDGQIHNVEQVAKSAKTIKNKLEDKIGIKLTKVAIAAAGRVLKTCEINVNRELEYSMEITDDVINSLELEAIQKAGNEVNDIGNRTDDNMYYCVGHSIIRYNLDGYNISTLKGHVGKNIGVSLIGTFLPHGVVTSLYTVMNKIELEVISLTLEPIAAINVAIPEELRLLNLALVDIGAGTSDIAITKDGTVTAYGMVPFAGDELTEKVAKEYLLDFNTAERVKVELSNNEKIQFTDILGITVNKNSNEVIGILDSTIDELAHVIANKILEFNQKTTNAVFLIGGGSQIPRLTAKVARILGLPKERVVVRGREIIKDIDYKGEVLSGPDAITPFGIAVTANRQLGKDFIYVSVNSKKVRLYNSKKIKVFDALALAGYNPNQLIGRRGKNLVFTVNGITQSIKGEMGIPAKIMVNETKANIETIIRAEDIINVLEAKDGKEAKSKVSNWVDIGNPKRVNLNGFELDITSTVMLNGGRIYGDKEINQGDVIEYTEIKNIYDLFVANDIPTEEIDIYVNDEKAGLGYTLKYGDSVTFSMDKANMFTKNNYESNLETSQMGDENNDDESNYITVNGNKHLLDKNKSEHLFVDVFSYVDLDLDDSKGPVILKLNGKDAGYTDILKPGDEIDVYLEKKM